jgi:hypothetical protein
MEVKLMFGLIDVTGYSPSNINYCPVCGERFPSVTYADGKMKCDDCGLVCYIVDAGESDSDSYEEVW